MSLVLMDTLSWDTVAETLKRKKQRAQVITRPGISDIGIVSDTTITPGKQTLRVTKTVADWTTAKLLRADAEDQRLSERFWFDQHGEIWTVYVLDAVVPTPVQLLDGQYRVRCTYSVVVTADPD